FYVSVWTSTAAAGALRGHWPAAFVHTRAPYERVGGNGSFCSFTVHQCSPGPDRGVTPASHAKGLNAALAGRFTCMVSERHIVSCYCTSATCADGFFAASNHILASRNAPCNVPEQ